MAYGRKHPDRAKQFSPFAALTGFYAMVEAETRTPSERHELTEEEIEDISATLGRLEKGSMVHVTYYDTDAYIDITGKVSEIVPEFHTLRIVKTTIKFEDLSQIELL